MINFTRLMESQKKIISFFLFLVMSIQVLPLQKIAAWLSSGQVTEEIAHSCNLIKAKSVNDETHPPFECHAYGAGPYSLFTSERSKNHSDEAIFIRHADDILSPPPNC